MPLIYTLSLFFLSLFLWFRPILSHSVICYITIVMCLFLVNIRKRKEKKMKNEEILEKYWV